MLLIHSASLIEENYDTLEYSKVKCYNGDSVRLWNPYSIERKKCPQAFLAVGAYQRHLAMTPADAKFGVAVFHEPRINPQAHGISL